MKKILLFLGLAAFANWGTSQVINTFPYNEDFENEIQCGTGCTSTCALVGDFENDPLALRQWLSDAGGTGSSPTGPSPQGFNSGVDHNPGTTTGKYLYAETSFPCSNGAQTYILNSPYFDFTSMSAINLSYWTNMYGNGIGFMHLDVDTTKGQGAWTIDYAPSFTRNLEGWFEEVVDLTQFAGRDSMRFRLRYINGNGFLGDAAIDDITVFTPPPVDFAALSLDNISTGCGLGSAEQVSFSAVHGGSDTLLVGDSIIANYSYSSTTGASAIVNETIVLASNLLTGDTVTHLFAQTVDLSQIGDYDFVVYFSHSGDTLDNSNDTIYETIVSVPSVSTIPYFEDFENGNGGWRSEGIGSTWELGTPAKPTIIGAVSGSNAWVVGRLDTQIVANEQSWLIGPCFDFSTVAVGEWFVAKLWWDSYEFGHGMRLEYSIDTGSTWNVLGDASAANWYNRTFVSGFPSSSDGWTGRSSTGLGSNGYVTVAHPLDSAIAGQADVQFRFYFGSTSTLATDGFAIDNFGIGKPTNADLGGDTSICDGYVIDPGLSATGTYRWMKDGQLLGLGSTFTLNNAGASPLSHVVILNYTDDLGFESSDTLNITVNPVPAPSILSSTNASCNGSSDGSATSTSISGANYLWSNGDTTAVANGLAAGSYTVTVTDSIGCWGTAMVTITEPTAIIASISGSTNASCNGVNDGSATVASSGGSGSYSYLWSNADTSASTSGLAAGTYTVTITDGNACTAQTSTTITAPTGVNIVINSSNVSCNGAADGLAAATGNGGTAPYSYLWSNGSSSIFVTSLAAGTYTVTATDANGCNSSNSTVITEPTALSAMVNSTNVSCNGAADGSANVSTTGGTSPYNYIWSNAATTDSISGLAAGNYLVTVSDTNNCSAVVLSTITEPAALNVGVTQSGFVLSANMMGASYQWLDCNRGDSAIVGETMQSLSVTANGSYSVEITMGGCVDTSACTAILSVGIENIKTEHNLAIYPNPTRNTFTLEVNNANKYELVQIFNLSGMLVQEIQLSSNKELVDVSSLADGIYMVKYDSSIKKLILAK